MSALEAVPHGAIRKGKWKLIEWYESSLTGNSDSAFELYDLENDLSETVNMSESMKTLTKEMSEELATWRRRVNAQMPVPTKLKDQSRRK